MNKKIESDSFNIVKIIIYIETYCCIYIKQKMPNKIDLNLIKQQPTSICSSYVQTNEEIIDLTGYLIFITKLKNGIIRLYGKYIYSLFIFY